MIVILWEKLLLREIYRNVNDVILIKKFKYKVFFDPPVYASYDII